MPHKKLHTLAALLLLFALAAPPSALADITAQRADGTGETVTAWKKKNTYYLFLPAYMRDEAVILHSDGNMRLMLADGSTSEEIALQDESAVSFKEGSQKRTLHILRSDSIPALHLTTESGSLAHIHAKKGNNEPGTMVVLTADGVLDYAGEFKEIKSRGNITFQYEKKPYQLKLKEKVPLLGMQAGKTFVLLANQHENTLLRNRVTFDLAESMGLRFTPEYRSVDLYINGEYRGNYLLTTKIRVSDASVDITDAEALIADANPGIDIDSLASYYQRVGSGKYKGIAWPEEPEDVSGGYLIELDRDEQYAHEDSAMVTAKGQTIIVKHPEQMTPAQGDYLYDLVSRLERALYAADGIVSKSGQRYTDIADLTSLAQKYLIEEISKNYDASNSSQFFYKDTDAVDPLLYAGPVWDYDSAWGNYGASASKPEGFYAARSSSASWWYAMTQHEDFMQAVRAEYWVTLRPLLLALLGEAEPPEGTHVRSLSECAAELSASAEMNFIRWQVLNYEGRQIKTGATYAENIAYLQSWIRRRVSWLDEQW